MKISLYLDEDSQRKALVQALRIRGVEVIVAWEVGMRNRSDEEHLLFATEQQRVLYGFNIGDFFQLHTMFLAQGRSHAGLVLAKQQTYSVGEEMRRLLKLIAGKTAEEMQNHLEFLSDWGE